MKVFFAFVLSVSCIFARQYPIKLPIVSGEQFRKIANHHLDDHSDNIDPLSVKNGDIIFVKTEMLDTFFHKIHVHVLFPYILITHNCDKKAPGQFASFLDDPNLFAWFAQNVEDYSHEKLTPIPIGIANSQYAHGKIDTFKKLRKRTRNFPKRHLLYMNINIGTNLAYRKSVYRQFYKKPYCFASLPNKTQEQYLEDLAYSRFVLSPRGNGIDCHRTYEALLMGSIPIVISSMLDPIFEGLPVLIIDDYEKLSKELLHKKYEEISSKQYQLEKLSFSYWKSMILEKQNEIRS